MTALSFIIALACMGAAIAITNQEFINQVLERIGQ